MQRSYQFKLIATMLLLLLLSTACRDRSTQTATSVPLPTAAAATATAEPTATPRAEPTEPPTAEPSATPAPAEPTPEPTAEPLLEADWEPQLIYSSPTAGQSTPLDGAITVRFDQPMDQASVEAAFNVDGDIDGDFMWTRPDTLVFTPEVALTRAQTYTVQIDDGARGINGKALRAPLALQFQTVGFLQVSQIIPADATDEVAVDSSITVMFNRPVVPLVSTSQQGELPNPITIEPVVEGVGTWVGTSIYRFQPTALDGATNYRVTVNEGLEDVTGGVLNIATTTDFTTVSPKVVDFELPQNFSSQQRFDQSLISPTDSITVTFNMPMDMAATEAVIAVEPSAELIFKWSADQTSVGVNSADFQLNTDYSLTVGAVQSASGAISDEASSQRFSTFPFPAVDFESTYPRPNTTLDQYEVGYFNSANVAFVSPMNWDTFEGAITVSPQPERFDLRFNAGQFVNVEFDVDYNGSYAMTIAGTVEDVFGNQLGEPVTINFSTPDYPPLAAFNLPPGTAQFSSSFPSDVAVAQRNIGETFVYLERFNTGVPVQTLMNSLNSSFGDGPVIFDETQLLREIRLDPIDGVNNSVLSLNDGAALANGVYRLSIEVPSETEQERQQAGWQNRSTFLIVADTNLVIKETPEQVYVWATDLATGQPAAGRNVRFYASYGDGITGAEPFATATTDENGLASAQKDGQLGTWQSWEGNVVAVTGAPDSAEFGLATSYQSTSIDPYQLGVSVDLSSEVSETAYIHTERPLYRAGDTVFIRGWLRDSNYARFFLPSPEFVGITLQSADYTVESSQLDDIAVDVNGNFAAEFVIPEDAALGLWTFSLNSDNQRIAGRSFASFTVAEFRKLEFAVSVVADKAEALRDDTVRFTISADYFFGGTATGLPVDWSIFATPYTPDRNGAGPYVNYGINDFTYGYNPFGGFFGSYVTGGSGELNASGELVVDVSPALLASLEDGSVTLTLDATVRDLSENFIAADAEVVLHSAETYVGIRAQEYVNTPDSDVAVALNTIDWDGNSVPNAAVEVVFAERRWESRQGDNGFGFGTIWESVDTEVARVSVTSDGSGDAVASFVPQTSGSYIATATVLDSAGRQSSSNAILYVFGSSARWRFDAADRKMALTTDANEYRVGDTAQIIVQSPFDTPTQAWLTIERGDVIEERIITLEPGGVLDIPIAADYAPNVFVGVTTIKPTAAGDRPWADIRFGLTELTVNPEQLALNIEIATDAAQYAPRNTVTYEITATDFNGGGVSAEISLALVDLAILTLKEDDAPTLLETFYAPVPLRSRLGSGLFNSAEGLANRIPDAFLGGRGGGGGGGGFAETASFDIERDGGNGADDVRSDFRDTAFWQATVTTGADGKATVDVTLPDNLTTWRMTARGVSPDDTLVGEATQDIIATKPLLIRPVTPRFFTFGDRVQLGAIVSNNTDSAIEGSVLLEATGLSFEDAAEQGVDVPANGSVVVRWPVFIEDGDAVDLTFSVESAEYSDATKPTVSQGDPIPVYRYDAEDIVATAGVLDEDNRRVEAVILPPLLDDKRGDLSVNLSPSLAAAIFDSLEAYGAEDDEIYQCPYGIALRILPNVATANAIRSLELDQPELLSELDSLTTQHIDRLIDLRLNNGWSWCYGSRQDAYVSAMVVHALSEAAQAGFAVDDRVIADGVEFVRESAESIDATRSPYSADRKAYFYYVVSLVEGGEVSAELDALLDEARDFLTPSGLALVQMAYDNSGVQPPANLGSDLANDVVLSATGAHWEGGYSFNFGSDIRTTATVIQALTQTDSDNPLLPNALRWLMAARDGRYWRSATENAWSIAAANSYMLATGEIDADYDYTLTVNGGLESDGSFSRANITDNELIQLPITDLQSQDVNYLDFTKDGEGSLYYAAFLDAFISADSVDAVDRGFSVERAYYAADCDANVESCEPLDSIAAGEEVRAELTIVVPNNRRFVQIEDPLPAGADAINPDLDTASIDATAGQLPTNGYSRGYWGWWYFNRIEFRDQKVVFLADYLPAGTYQYSYNLNTIVPGAYQVMPTLAQETATPEVFGRSNGQLFTITP